MRARITAVFLFVSPILCVGQNQRLPSQASALLKQADRMTAQGDRYRAAPLYTQAESLFRSQQDARGEIQARLGRLRSSTDHGDYKSIKDAAQAELRKPVVQNDAELKIKALALVGLVDLNVDTVAAGEDFSQLLAVAAEAHNLKWQNRARGELAILAGINGNVAEAGMGLFKAIATSQKIEDWEGAFYFTLWLANGMSVNGMADGALKQLDKADALAKKSGFEEAPLALTIAHIRAIANLNDEDRQKHSEEAERLYSRALRLAKEDAVPGAEIELLTQHGKLAFAAGNRPEAEQSFSNAIQVARKSALRSLEVESVLNLADLFLSANEPERAKRLLDRSISAAHATPDRLELPRFLGVQADTAAALHQVRKADRLYERATTDLEGLLVNAPSSRVKASMLATYSHIYVAHFRLAFEQLHDLARAFRIIESARGRVLLDSLLYSRTSSASSRSSPHVARITTLQSALLHEHLTQTEAHRLLANLDAAYDQLGAQQPEQNRQEVSVLRGSPVPLSAFSRSLDLGTVFVEYVLDRDASFAFEVSASGEAQVHRLPSRSHLEKLVASYVSDLKAKKDSAEKSATLFSELLKPFLRSDCKAIILVPDGALHLLPFQSLQDDRKRFLVSQVSTSFAPSATVLSAIRNTNHKPAQNLFLGIAYSSMNTEDAISTRDLADLRGADIKPLKYSAEEVMQATKALGNQSSILVGEHASESDLKHQNLSEFRVIHMAAHAFGDQVQPDRAGMVLYPGAKTEDGLWQAREIRATKLRADLIVLSACGTGIGRLVGEEGIMNLARAFLAAGARSVVASQWDIDDRSTATLMENYYQQLATGKTVQEALRLAQLTFLQNYGTKASPYYWAGFSVYGDGRRTISETSTQTQQKTARTDLR